MSLELELKSEGGSDTRTSPDAATFGGVGISIFSKLRSRQQVITEPESQIHVIFY